MTKKFIHYKKKHIYALCYKKEKIIYYNLDFKGKTQIILIVF